MLCILPYTSVNVRIVNGQRLKFNTVNRLQQVKVELTQSKEENQLLYMEKQDQASRFCQLQQLLQASQEREQQAQERERVHQQVQEIQQLVSTLYRIWLTMIQCE